MKNRLLSRVFGESDDVVPVLASVPRRTSRDRGRVQPDDDEGDDVKRMVGEASNRVSVIPDDAEPVDPAETTDGKPLRAPKDIVQEPSHPAADKEKYLTPYSALTAPDVTPLSTQPIDPSEVPGTPSAEKFTAADLEQASEVGGDMEQPNDNAAKAMDILLGKNRASKPPTQPGEFEQAGAVTTEQAEALLGVNKVVLQEEARAKAAAALTAATPGSSEMPAPAPHSDGAKIYNAFRRFAG